MSEDKESLVEKAEETLLDSFLAGLKKWVTGLVIAILSWFAFMTLCVIHLPTIYNGMTDMGIIRKVDHAIGKYVIVQFAEGTVGFIPKTNKAIAELRKENESLKLEIAEIKKDLRERILRIEQRSSYSNVLQMKGK